MIVIGDYRISRRIIRQLIRDKEKEISDSEKLASNIIYCTTEFSNNISELKFKFMWHQNEETLEKTKKVLVSLARLQQNCLAEISKLWHDNVNLNLLLNIEFHELQVKSVYFLI